MRNIQNGEQGLNGGRTGTGPGIEFVGHGDSFAPSLGRVQRTASALHFSGAVHNMASCTHHPTPTGDPIHDVLAQPHLGRSPVCHDAARGGGEFADAEAFVLSAGNAFMTAARAGSPQAFTSAAGRYADGDPSRCSRWASTANPCPKAGRGNMFRWPKAIWGASFPGMRPSFRDLA